MTSPLDTPTPRLTLTLTAGHPFFECANVAVWQQSWDRLWTVRWRDFWTIKQSREFATEQEARAFASTLFKPPITLEDEMGGGEWISCYQFWRALAAKHYRKGNAP
jgi:hypothetical protein